MITASAPGKVVLWGEYAVLEGAPAAVLAVNRYARCSLETSGSWRFAALGFDAPAAQFNRLPATPPAEPAATLPWYVVQALPELSSAPVSATLDTEAFFQSGVKLGLGSSAALCVALQAAFAGLTGRAPDHAQALAAHRRAQAGLGSGIDIAASFFGGCLRFQDGNAEPFPNPLVHRCFVWVGTAAQTVRKLGLFSEYLKRGGTSALRALADCSEHLFDNPTIAALRAYNSALKILDKAARLGVYSAPHLAAERLAKAAGLVYKPCGAGGGDVGLAVAEAPEPLLRFAASAQALGFAVLNLQTARQGVHLGIR